MRKLSVFLALLVLIFAQLAVAAGAVITSTTGTVSVQTGQASPRTLRTGDQVAQGDTVITGANSAAVMKFDDGQVVALTANSRMQVTNYAYNPATESGNVLLRMQPKINPAVARYLVSMKAYLRAVNNYLDLPTGPQHAGMRNKIAVEINKHLADVQSEKEKLDKVGGTLD